MDGLLSERLRSSKPLPMFCLGKFVSSSFFVVRKEERAKSRLGLLSEPANGPYEESILDALD